MNLISYQIPYTRYRIPNSAAAAITAILIIGGIVAEIAIASLIASYYASQSGLATRTSYTARYAAQSGIDDAFMRITRDKDWSPSPNTYTLTLTNATVQITVCKDKTTVTTACDTAATTGTFEVTSLGTSVGKQIRMRAFLYADPNTGLVNIKSLNEISV